MNHKGFCSENINRLNAEVNNYSATANVSTSNWVNDVYEIGYLPLRGVSVAVDYFILEAQVCIFTNVPMVDSDSICVSVPRVED